MLGRAINHAFCTCYHLLTLRRTKPMPIRISILVLCPLEFCLVSWAE
uniref:Uncharacterized protein n=1 Tax=Arundo donax TaxID=35708 RepID=A0A0A8Z6W0_ARUDO